jgi:hypothetical protein
MTVELEEVNSDRRYHTYITCHCSMIDSLEPHIHWANSYHRQIPQAVSGVVGLINRPQDMTQLPLVRMPSCNATRTLPGQGR